MKFLAENSNQPGREWQIDGRGNSAEFALLTQAFQVLSSYSFNNTNGGTDFPIAITVHFPDVDRKITQVK